MSGSKHDPVLITHIVLYLFIVKISDATVVELAGDKHRILIQTCRGDCGLDRSVPCSCNARCLVLGNCCENITEDCPGVIEEATRSSIIGSLLGAPVSCQTISPNIGVIMIDSCLTARKINEIPGSNVGLDNVDMLRRGEDNFQRLTPIEPVMSSTNKTNISEMSKLEKVLQSLPVTDIETGYTFKDMSVYQCYKQYYNISNNIFNWTLRIPVGSTQSNPLSLDELEAILDKAMVEPVFDTSLIKGSLCLPWATGNCKPELVKILGINSSRELCHSSTTSYVLAIEDKHVYRNRFCLDCNFGKNSEMIIWFVTDKLTDKPNFSILFKVSHSGEINLSFETEGLNFFGKVSWTETRCSYTSEDKNIKGIERGKNSQLHCAPTCNSGFTVRPDGVCKTVRKLMVATPNTPEIIRCQSLLPMLPKILRCGFQNWSTHAEISIELPTDLTLRYDERIGSFMHVIKLQFYFTEIRRFFGKGEQSVISRMYGLASLSIQAFFNVCTSGTLIHIETSSNFTPLIQRMENPSIENMTSVRYESTQKYSPDLHNGFMESMRGEVFPNKSGTMVCLSDTLELADPVHNLACLLDDARLDDDKLVEVLLNSTCFKTLLDSHNVVLSFAKKNDAVGLSSEQLFLMFSITLLHEMLRRIF